MFLLFLERNFYIDPTVKKYRTVFFLIKVKVYILQAPKKFNSKWKVSNIEFVFRIFQT